MYGNCIEMRLNAIHSSTRRYRVIREFYCSHFYKIQMPSIVIAHCCYMALAEKKTDGMNENLDGNAIQMFELSLITFISMWVLLFFVFVRFFLIWARRTDIQSAIVGIIWCVQTGKLSDCILFFCLNSSDLTLFNRTAYRNSMRQAKVVFVFPQFIVNY